METSEKTYSLIDDLGLRNHYEVVAEKNGKLVYSRTVYYELAESDYDDFITEDDEPMDNLLSEKIQRLLVDSLQSSAFDWTERDFMACANVAIYYAKGECIVPDMFLSLDVRHPKSWREKKNKYYLLWHMKKLPELALEVVSNKVGKEDSEKMSLYADLGIKYYIIYDPYFYLSKEELRVYQLHANQSYVLIEDETNFMPEINLGIQLWKGFFEKEEGSWARWCSKEGEIIRTGSERAEDEATRAEAEKQRAESEAKKAEAEKQRADAEKQRADAAEVELQKLKEQLKALGLNGDKD